MVVLAYFAHDDGLIAMLIGWKYPKRTATFFFCLLAGFFFYTLPEHIGVGVCDYLCVGIVCSLSGNGLKFEPI